MADRNELSEARRARDEPPRIDWFRDWFGDEYLELYPHRDEAEAVRAVELLLTVADLTPGSLVLDLASGAGRHLEPIGHAGLRPIGLDLSWPLLSRARSVDRTVPLVRADMRHLPVRDESLAAVASFFTSFGYFVDESDDVRVMEEVFRVLRPGGTFLLDYLNASRVRDGLVRDDEREVSGRLVRQQRRIDGRRVIKRIEIRNIEDGSRRVFHESVRLYEPSELQARLLSAGLTPDRWFGDYDGSDFDHASPRLIIVGHRGDA